MTIWQIVLELAKIASPIATVVIGARLAAHYYDKNKKVDYTFKLTEKALEQVYNPIVTKIEKDSQNPDFSYEGLSADDLEQIGKVFSENRHLVHDELIHKLWEYEEEIHHYLTGPGKDEKYAEYNKVLDNDGAFYRKLLEIRKNHLKTIGFYSEGGNK